MSGRDPRATPTRPADDTDAPSPGRAPQAFAAPQVQESEDPFSESADTLADAGVAPEPARTNALWWRILWGAGGALVSLGLGLAADRLIRDLFARYDWLGWIGLGLLGVFVIALVVLVFREVLAIARLRTLDRLRERAVACLVSDDLKQARSIAGELDGVYSRRSDLARARDTLAKDSADMLDGAELVRLNERALMGPLDTKARALTAASARRVALVTALSPRALIDLGFVVFESARLARNIAELYGARPGLLGYLGLARAILAHLAVTGGLVLTDGVVEQLLGQGLATKLSARLGEGVVNGLMTVRVGIAAIRVVRPLPFSVARAPVVTDFAGELARTSGRESTK